MGTTAYQSANDTSGGNIAVAAWIDSTHVPVDISLTITTAQAGNAVAAGITFRFLTATSNCFFLTVNRSAAGALSWNLQKRVAAVQTNLANGALGSLTTTLRIVDTGTSIDAYVGGTLVATVSDSNLNTNTKQGIIIFYTGTGANSGTGWRFDDYSVRA